MTELDRNNFRLRRPMERTVQRPVDGIRSRSAPMPAVPDLVTPQTVARFKDHLRRMLATAGHSWAYGEHQPFNNLVQRLPMSWQRQVAAYRRGALLQRLAFTGIAAVLVFSLALPLLNVIISHQRYDLSDATSQLLGPTDSNLVSQITYDSQSSSYYFNKSGITTNNASPAAALESQVGGSSKNNKSLYSVQLPSDPTKGITYYDDNLDLSFSLTPQLKLMAPQEEQGRVVYPAADGVQDVFTTKNNGLKDDIVLTKVGADTESYSYNLHLPDTLRAKMIDGTGEIGIYSADPALYNNITFGDSASKADVMKARVNGAKTNLVFVLPAPIIKEYNAKTHASVAAPAAAHFVLSPSGKQLTVDANGLSKLSYPLTIDPSVVTTSTSDFATGNNEDNNINYSTGNQIGRGAVTGGTLGSWTGGTSLTTASQNATSVAYNGYLYEIGGSTTNVYYAPINSNGSLGSWTSTTALASAIAEATAVTYNGYIYVIGGLSSSTVYYSQINTSNGTLGTWNTTTSLGANTYTATSVAYNGYIYEIGGCSTSCPTVNVYYAPVNADGTLGSWTSTTGLTAATDVATSVVYNGYLYELGGSTSGGLVANTYYAPINANGSLGSWTSTTGLTAATDFSTTVVASGYIYELGGCLTGGCSSNTTANTYYAPINANGTIGTWNATTGLGAATTEATSATYGGYVYELGGCTGTNCSVTPLSTVTYSQISTPGVAAATSWNTSANTTATKEASMCTVAYNGYLYIYGGGQGVSPYLNTTQYAAINGDGSIGTWTNASNTFASSFGNGRTKMMCAAYNGYLYIAGGWDQTNYYNDIQQSLIGTSGAPGAWSTETTTLPVGMYGAGLLAYNGFLYLTGGNPSGSAVANVYYASLNSTTGAVNSWTSAASLNTATIYGRLLVYNNFLYVVAGAGPSNTDTDVVEYDSINANGSLGGSWTSQTYTPVNREQNGAAIWNGYLYMYGGSDTTNSPVDSDVDYAPLNANGSIGTWATTTSMPNARYGFGFAFYNGYIYFIGGRESSGSAYANDTQYMALNNGGLGTTGTWGSTASNLASFFPGDDGTSYVGVAAADGFLYAVGGDPGVNGTGGSGAISNVYYAPLTNGAPGTWTATSAMTLPRASEAVQAYNGYIYAFGGFTTSGSSTANVEYALICTGSNSGVSGCGSTPGTLGTWTLGTSFTDANMAQQVAVVEYNGYFYALGGFKGSTYSSTVNYAPINANGSVGNWTATTSMPSGRTLYQQAAVYNGYIYIFGGVSSGGQLGDMAYAQINSSTHAVGSFTDVSNALPYALLEFGNVEALNGYMYIYSGLGSQPVGTSVGRTAVYYASIGPNGTLGPWELSTSMGTKGYDTGGTIYNGYLYILGGTTSTPDFTFNTQYTPVNSIPETGHYSKLIDLGSATDVIDSITYNGNLPNGQVAINYETAGSNAILSSPATAYSLGTSLCLTGYIVPSTRYVWVNLTLDDSSNVIFPDVDSSAANVTDFTVNYAASVHPTPQTRLRGGQTLKSGTLSPLDTCLP